MLDTFRVEGLSITLLNMGTGDIEFHISLLSSNVLKIEEYECSFSNNKTIDAC